MSTIKSKEDAAYIVGVDDLIPVVNNAGTIATAMSVSQLSTGLGVPATDVSGNILASVIPRQDTLANLLLISDAGEGETALATDLSCSVVYRGNPSVGVPVFNNGLSAASYSTFNESQPVLAGETFIPTFSETAGSNGTTSDNVLGEILLPAHFSQTALSSSILLEANFSLLGIGLDPFSNFQVLIQRFSSSNNTWQNFKIAGTLQTVEDTGSLVMDGHQEIGIDGLTARTTTKLRMTIAIPSSIQAGAIIFVGDFSTKCTLLEP